MSKDKQARLRIIDLNLLESLKDMTDSPAKISAISAIIFSLSSSEPTRKILGEVFDEGVKVEHSFYEEGHPEIKETYINNLIKE